MKEVFIFSYEIWEEPVVCAKVHDEDFWTEDLIEETMKRLEDSYTILTLIEHDMSAQMKTNSPHTQSCT